MDTQTFKVANVKCGGCVANIKKGVGTMSGVDSVEADAANGQVVVSGTAERAELVAKLAELGYPEVV